MSIHPLPQKKDVCDVSSFISWNVPFGPNVHKVSFYHEYQDKFKFEMDFDGENKKIYTRARTWSDFFTCVGERSYCDAPIDTEFELGDLKVTVTISVENKTFLYTLKINDKPFQEHQEEYHKTFAAWSVKFAGKDYRIVMDRATLELWANGLLVKKSEGNFGEDGTSFSFSLDENQFRLESRVDKGTETSHTLFVNDEIVSLMVTMESGVQKREALFFLTMDRVGV